jgi:hypothetical protein
VDTVAVVHHGDRVAVSWTPAEHATGYRVVYRIDDKAGWTYAATNHVDTTYILTEADESATYTFAVGAVNDAGESAWVLSAPASR